MRNGQITALVVLVLALLLATAPAFAQGRGAGGPPPNKGQSGGAVVGASSHGSESSSHGTRDMAHSSPSAVLSHNTAIAGKIKTLTGEDAQTACNGFKNLGQCVAAAHVAKNLNIPGGFDALKKAVNGPPSDSLGKAIQNLKPDADSKAEIKKANKQAADDMKETGS